jgi:hypothetical protein
MFTNRMSRKILEPKRGKIKEDGEIDVIKQTMH